MLETLTADGFTLLGGGNQIGVTGYAGLFGAPPPRDASEPRADGDGVVELTRRYQPRVVTLAGWVKTSDWATFYQLLDTIGELFAQGVDHELLLTRGDGVEQTLSYRAIIDLSVDQAGGVGSYCTWATQIRAADPVKYGTVSRGASLDPLSGGPGGISIPLVFPLDLGGAGAGTILISNQGSYPARPVYTLNGPWVNPWIENTGTADTIFTKSVDLASSDVLVIDTTPNGGVTLNGALRNDLVDWPNSSYPLLSPGSNLLRVGGTAQSGALLQVSSFDAFII